MNNDSANLLEAIAFALRQSPSTFIATCAEEGRIQIERGLMLVDQVLGRSRNQLVAERLIDLALANLIDHVSIVDRLGHSRSVYRGLLVSSWLLANAESADGRERSAMTRWCATLQAEINQFDQASLGEFIPASNGNSTAAASWAAVGLMVAGHRFSRADWSEQAAGCFRSIIRTQRAGGNLLEATAADSIELVGYHELIMPHAMKNFATFSKSDDANAAAGRAAEFHLREMQADHATTQPWAMRAFLEHPAGHGYAEALLHASHASGQASGVSLMLLADCLYWRRASHS